MSFETTDELVRQLKNTRKFCREARCDTKSETVAVESVGDILFAIGSMLIANKQAHYRGLPNSKNNKGNP